MIVGSGVITRVMAQAAPGGDSGLGGWWVGTAIGVLVVIIVAAVVITIIMLARRIGRQAGMAIEALEAGEQNTRGLWDVGTTNQHALAILEGAVRAREAVEAL